MYLTTISGCSKIKTAAKPENGTLDITQWDFEKDGNIKLDGEWDFYWNALLSYEELQIKKADMFVRIPDTWDKYEIDGAKLIGTGVATYRLRVKTAVPAGTIIGLRIRTASSAYKLFINDKLKASAGKLGVNYSEEEGEYTPKTVFFSVPDKQFDIIIQVSNFHYARGGLWESIYIGDSDNIQKLENRLVFREALLLGVLLIIALFYLTVYFLLRDLRYSIYSALLCVFGALSIDMVGQFIIVTSSLPFEVVIALWYSATTWLVFFIIMLMHALYPSVFSRIISRVYLAWATIFQLMVIIFDTDYYTRFSNVANISETLALLCALIIIVAGISKGQKSWILNLLSIITLFACYIHDILLWMNIIHSQTGEIFYFGVLISLTLQMAAQAQRIQQYYNQKVSSELMFLQAQIKPHFLFNAINTIISISRIDGDRARELLIDFSQYLRRSFDMKGKDQMVTLSQEIELAKAYISIEKARFGSRLEVNFDIQEGILQDRVPILVLQPIIENAVIHGVLPKPEGGSVNIVVKKDRHSLCFSVKDSGIGADKNKLEMLTAGYSGGIGLPNIDARLRRLYGNGLSIRSEINQGTEIRWCTHG